MTTSAGEMDQGPAWPTDWRAYRTLMGCFFLMFNSWGLVNAYGTFSSFYMESLMPNIPIYLLNLIGSTESFVVLSLSFAMGRLLDAGFSRYILFTGWILVSTGMFTLSVSSGNGRAGQGNYSLIWVTQGLTQGLGMACFFVASSQSEYLKLIYIDSADPSHSRCNMVHSSKIVCDWHCGLWRKYWYVQ
jgi:MCP family monocarboxylic acid transporter-like MFS transporter 10